MAHSDRANRTPPLTRRQFLGVAGGCLTAAAGVRAVAARTPGTRAARARSGARLLTPARYACVGCFTTASRKGRGEGLAVYRIDPASGRWDRAQLVAAEVNPSFLAVDKGCQFLYAVHADTDQVSSFSIDAQSGALTLVNRQSTGGANPAHLAIDPAGRHLATANYGAGNVAVLPIGADGRLGARTDLFTLAGETGPHRVEQASSHPHQCVFDPAGRFIVVPDKGLDRVFVFRLDRGSGKLVPADLPFVKTRAGAGPRHVDFHPRLPYAYVANELESTLTTCRVEAAGRLEPVQIVPSVPATFTGDNTAAEILVSPSGRFVYASNRGHDSVGAFAVNAATGVLTPVGWETSGGTVPRFICLDPTGTRLYAANQGSDTIVEFKVDDASGRLARTGLTIATGTPVCIVFW